MTYDYIHHIHVVKDDHVQFSIIEKRFSTRLLEIMIEACWNNLNKTNKSRKNEFRVDVTKSESMIKFNGNYCFCPAQKDGCSLAYTASGEIIDFNSINIYCSPHTEKSILTIRFVEDLGF